MTAIENRRPASPNMTLIDRRSLLKGAGVVGVGTAMGALSLAGRAISATPKTGGSLRIGLGGGGATDSLDPALAGSQVPFHLCRMFGEPLLEVAPSGDSIQPRLAVDYGSNDDSTVWTFQIRKGVKFHDGSALRASDVAATLMRHINSGSQSVAYGIVQDITSVVANGDDVVMTVGTPTVDFPYLMTSYNLVIQPDGGMDNPASGIGTSPYKLMSAEPGVRYQFSRFPDYWDSGRGYFDDVELVVINDPTSRVAALQSGQVHMITALPPKIANIISDAQNLRIRNVSGRGHYAFSMMCDTAPFDNNDVRLALKYAINRQDILEKVLLGYGSIGNDSPISRTYPLFDSTIPQREFDPDKARYHYERSGHDGSPIVLHSSDVAFPGAMDAAALFEMTAQSAGIPLQIRREPSDGYWSDVWLKDPFVATYWNGRAIQDQMYSTAYVTGSAYNETHFSNPKFDEIVRQARGERDDAIRRELYSEAFHLVRDEGGIILPVFNEFIDGVSERIGGWEDDVNQELMNGYAAQKCWFVD